MRSKLFAPVDMTEGDPVIQIIKFTIPMLLGNIAQQLYKAKQQSTTSIGVFTPHGCG